MLLLDRSRPTPAENLALDEALLEAAEASDSPQDLLRLWECPTFAVVQGRASRTTDEVRLDACRTRGIPVLRRCSGGCSVVIGPGCLMYSVVLSYATHPELQLIDQAHRFVLTKTADALRLLLPDIRLAGTSDLTLGSSQLRKVSGNSLRCQRTHLLYHGTLLYDFPLDLIATCLRPPPRQPEYREGRSHESFVTNLNCSGDDLRSALRASWDVTGSFAQEPNDLVERLVAERYSRDEWNLRL